MANPERPAAGGVSRRSVLGWMVASAVALPSGIAAAAPTTARAAPTGSTIAPRAYFPADVTKIPPTASLPDLFRFFSSVGSPNGHDRVTRASQWPARAAELSDLMQYYLFGFKHPTPETGSVFRQVPVPATTIVNFRSVFSFATFSVNLPPGSFNLDFSSFTITPVLNFAATQPYTAPAGFQSWAVGDTWSTPAHASLLVTIPATTRMVVDVSDPGAAGSTTATIKLDAMSVPKQGVDTDIAGPYP